MELKYYERFDGFYLSLFKSHSRSMAIRDLRDVFSVTLQEAKSQYERWFHYV